jgi:hypothetical protein
MTNCHDYNFHAIENTQKDFQLRFDQFRYLQKVI